MTEKWTPDHMPRPWFADYWATGAQASAFQSPVRSSWWRRLLDRLRGIGGTGRR